MAYSADEKRLLHIVQLVAVFFQVPADEYVYSILPLIATDFF